MVPPNQESGTLGYLSRFTPSDISEFQEIGETRFSQMEYNPYNKVFRRFGLGAS